MGASKVQLIHNEFDKKKFTNHLLKDIKALDLMLTKRMFETDMQRIGAEQELYLVDKYWNPAPVATQLLPLINDGDFTTEFARFNIELNLSPIVFSGDALSKMEQELTSKLAKARKAAKQLDTYIVQVGILPTVKRKDIGAHNVTPLPRYRMLEKKLHEVQGGMFDIHIEGIDELILTKTHVLYEASNTSFQLHYQVAPDDFAMKYNWSQAITGPLLAVAGNAPFLLGNRLWQETRIALFQQSIDSRNAAEYLRRSQPRVSFGNSWVKNSVLELYQEDITRHTALLKTTQEEDPFKKLSNGEIPKLRALGIHNGTVYRWNRPCYGITNGKPHLRIENRVIPSGPSSIDEMATAAFWFGMMHGMPDQYQNIHEKTDFDYAKNNFYKAARNGLDTHFRWTGLSKPITARDLILKELLPIAKRGLKKANINQTDIDKYLNIIEERTRSGKTGAKWQIRSFEKIKRNHTKNEALTAITAGMYQRQLEDKPVHTWSLTEKQELGNILKSNRPVRQIMTTDLFIVNDKDNIALAASIMNWQTIRHILVENDKKELVGVISVRDFVRWFASADNPQDMPTVYEIMSPSPVTISPDTTILNAVQMLHEKHIACLPVVEKGKLLGVVSEHDFSKLTLSLLEAEN